MIPQFPAFKNLEISDKEEIEAITQKFPPYSDFNFVSLWSWDVHGNVKVSILNNNLVARLSDYVTDEIIYSVLGESDISSTVDLLIKFIDTNDKNGRLGFIPNFIADEYNRINNSNLFTRDRDHFDYIYKTDDLFNAVGSKYETQRNQVNRFIKTYNNISVNLFNSFPFDLRESILSLQQKWVLSKISQNKIDEFKKETSAMLRLFSLDTKNIKTIAIYDQDNLIAFCIFEIINNSSFSLAHFAKFDKAYSGLNSYMLKELCRVLVSLNIEYLNYEQDLGIDYLRQSKLSFRPDSFLEKNRAL